MCPWPTSRSGRATGQRLGLELHFVLWADEDGTGLAVMVTVTLDAVLGGPVGADALAGGTGAAAAARSVRATRKPLIMNPV